MFWLHVIAVLAVALIAFEWLYAARVFGCFFGQASLATYRCAASADFIWLCA